MDFEQLAFIEKWRRRAVRGLVVGLEAAQSGVLLTLRVGDFGETIDLRGRDETGAVRKQRVTLGDRLFVAFRYRVDGVARGTGGGSARLVGKGAEVEGTLSAAGELVEVDLNGATILIEGADLGGISAGEAIRFRVADEGNAYVIPTR